MTRHASLSEQLKALLAYRNRPEGPIEPVKTNWKTVVANDNNPEDLEDLHIERSRPIRPRLGEIMESVRNGETVRNDDGQVVAIGGLRFSDGTQTEKAHRFSVDGKLVEYDARMPAGAMLKTSERQERILGGDSGASNSAYTLTYGGRHPSAVDRKDTEDRAAEKPAPKRSKAEMRAEIAALLDVPIKHCGKGFPWRPRKLRELFMGLEKGRKGETGSVAWEDISTHIVEREIWVETLAALAKEDAATLDVALGARTMREVGESHGFVGKRAERMGKKILSASNDNLSDALKKSAA
jgi:hypothetical protein